MGGVLKHDVHVPVDEAAGEWEILPAGSKVPKKFEHYVTNPKAFVAEVEERESGESEGDESRGYSDLKGDELRELLKQRELPQTGTNAEMVERLTADDSERESGESEGDESKGD